MVVYKHCLALGNTSEYSLNMPENLLVGWCLVICVH